MSRAEAIEEFTKHGWEAVTDEFQTYDEFLAAVDSLGIAQYLSDIHVQNLFVFPWSSKQYWAKNYLVKESKVVLQDKVRYCFDLLMQLNEWKLDQTIFAVFYLGQLFVIVFLGSTERLGCARYVCRPWHENHTFSIDNEESWNDFCCRIQHFAIWNAAGICDKDQKFDHQANQFRRDESQ